MEEKHRVAIQGLPLWQDKGKFPNDKGRRTLLEKKRKIDHVNYKLAFAIYLYKG